MNDRDRLITAITDILERATAAAGPMTEYQCIVGIAQRVLGAVNVHPYVTAGFLADEDPMTAEEDADRCRDETEAQARNEAIQGGYEVTFQTGWKTPTEAEIAAFDAAALKQWQESGEWGPSLNLPLAEKPVDWRSNSPDEGP